MRSLTLISMLAASAFVLTHCAPSSTRHSSTISKPAGAGVNKNSPTIKDPKTGKDIPNPNYTPKPGTGTGGTASNSCKSATQASDAAALVKSITDQITGARFVTIESLAAGRYTLVTLVSNLEVQDSQSTYEMVQRFNVTKAAAGARLDCIDNQYAGEPATLRPADAGREIMIEGSFDLDANKKVARPVKMDLNQRGNQGGANGSTNFLDQSSTPRQQLDPNQDGIIAGAQKSFPGSTNPQYQYKLENATVTVQLAQTSNNQLLVYIDVLENNSTNLHRQFLLTYSVDTTTGASPTP